MSERRVVRMDLTPGSWTGPMALSEDFDTAALAGRALPMKGPGGEELGDGRIVEAAVIDGRLMADVLVPESLAELVTPKIPGMFGAEPPWVQRAQVRSGEGGIPHEVSIARPSVTVSRYGGTYSIRKAIRCGFRSRRRVQGARALARSAERGGADGGASGVLLVSEQRWFLHARAVGHPEGREGGPVVVEVRQVGRVARMDGRQLEDLNTAMVALLRASVPEPIPQPIIVGISEMPEREDDYHAAGDPGGWLEMPEG